MDYTHNFLEKIKFILSLLKAIKKPQNKFGFEHEATIGRFVSNRIAEIFQLFYCL